MKLERARPDFVNFQGGISEEISIIVRSIKHGCRRPIVQYFVLFGKALGWDVVEIGRVASFIFTIPLVELEWL